GSAINGLVPFATPITAMSSAREGAGIPRSVGGPGHSSRGADAVLAATGFSENGTVIVDGGRQAGGVGPGGHWRRNVSWAAENWMCKPSFDGRGGCKMGDWLPIRSRRGLG